MALWGVDRLRFASAILLAKIGSVMADVFTYGSLMCADIMSAVCGHDSRSEPARLVAFRRYAVLDENYPGLIEDAGAECHGVLYRDISEQGLRRLDVFEGEYYRRQNVVITYGNESNGSAQTYVFRPEYRHFLADWPWSFEYFLAVGKSQFTRAYLGFQKIPNQT